MGGMGQSHGWVKGCHLQHDTGVEANGCCIHRDVWTPLTCAPPSSAMVTPLATSITTDSRPRPCGYRSQQEQSRRVASQSPLCCHNWLSFVYLPRQAGRGHDTGADLCMSPCHDELATRDITLASSASMISHRGLA